MTAILKYALGLGTLVVDAEEPRAEANTDISTRTPTGPTIHLDPGADIGAAVYANPDATIECSPGVYPPTTFRKPPGHGYTTVRPTGTLEDRPYKPADVASGVHIIGTGGAAWGASAIAGEIPYRINLLGVHASAPANSHPLTFCGVADLAIEKATRTQDLPWDWLLDRCVNQTPSTTDRRWAFLANGVSIGGINSYFGPAHWDVWPAGVDSQGLGFYQGPGPFTFRKCVIWGAEEPVASGNAGNDGVGNACQSRMSDFLFEHCLFYRAPAARRLIQCKNGSEFKQGSRVKYRYCIIRNTWPDTQQAGWGYFTWSGAEEFWSGTHDHILEGVWFQNTAGIAGFDPHFHDRYNPAFKRLLMRNCVATGFSAASICSAPEGGRYHDRAFEFDQENSPSGVHVVHEATIERSLVFTSGRGINELVRIAPQLHRNFRFRGNLMGVAPGGTWGPKILISDQEGDAAVAGIAGSGFSWTKNTIVAPAGAQTVTTGTGVSDNNYPASIAALQLVDATQLDNTEPTPADLGGLKLSGTSPYLGTGLAGDDPGPDIDTLITEHASVPTV